MHKDICPHDGKYCTCYPVCEANGENMDSSNDKVQRIIRFCEDVIGMKLEPWQRTWLKNWVAAGEPKVELRQNVRRP